MIDSGATIHVMSQKEFFSSYTPGNFGIVRMGNENFLKISSIGDVCLETENGTQLVLKDVRHIPDMRLNLISTSRLDGEGFCNAFFDGK